MSEPWKAALARLVICAEPIAEDNTAAYKRIIVAHIDSLTAERDAYFAALAAIVWKRGGTVVLTDAELMDAPRTLESFDNFNGKRVIRTAAAKEADHEG